MNKFGNLPQTKQEITANQCPMQCGEGSAILCARPPGGTIANWWSRCQRCLTYWETSPAGNIMRLHVIERTDICPDCRLIKAGIHVCGSKKEA